ncbi:hypothetical protein [Mucilaginibacter auburnensis]|uniref:Uncharacterized protein n=1 Tax=Mucilaginibacter auburnensis TaxID=1457233 RepID=A0A2H9VSF9_9SPHI|nr:hypothetical protein [Mucilaginibacter auburnensis]PJJ83729.1 hypothetical protein CLV57_0722 [Mucilaginibacter auburnensis]
METAINYWWLLPVLILLLILVGWMIRRNATDEKKFEKELIDSEMKPRKHNEHDSETP